MAGNEINLTMREMDRLIDWMRRTGKPQTVRSLTERYLEMLREDRGMRGTITKK